MYFYCNCEFVLYKYIYIYVYGYTKVIFYVCILNKNWTTSEERATVHICEWNPVENSSYSLWMYSRFCSTDTYPTWMLLLLLLWQKKVLLTSEERTDVELQAGHILAIILHNYLFLNLFAHMSQNPSSFKFKY